MYSLGRRTNNEMQVELVLELFEVETYGSQRRDERMVDERRRIVERQDVGRPGGGLDRH